MPDGRNQVAIIAGAAAAHSVTASCWLWLGSNMTDSPWYAAAHNWRMRAAEICALADEFKEAEPKANLI
jgi:hypothetical protein